jgi:hypothetical protein
VHVQGTLRAGDLITAGELVVGGDLTVSGTIVGDYNDGRARIGGNLTARLFAPTDHPFRVGGRVRADFVLARGSIADRAQLTETAWADLPLAEPFDLGALCARVRSGRPILDAPRPTKPARRRRASSKT